MTNLRPYLLRALIDWIVDNDCTPHAVIDCTVGGAEGLADYATDGKLVLNLSAMATRNLLVDDHTVSVDCRFQGRAVHVSVPLGAVTALYARENGMGMVFGAETSPDDASPAQPAERGPKVKKAPTLKLVK